MIIGTKTTIIPNTVRAIGPNAFDGCTGLTSITIPNSVTSIGASAFSSSGLISIDIPSSVTTIDNFTFDECRHLTSVTIPESVTSIGNFAFSDCIALSSISIPSHVTSISSTAFIGCSNLTSTCVSPQNTVYHSPSNCQAIIKTAENTLIVGTNNPISIANVSSIGPNAYNGRSNITNITLPSTVNNIGDGAFQGCSSLTTVTVHRVTPPNLGASVFSGVSMSSATLNVPCGQVEDYRNASQWPNFGTILQPSSCCHATYSSISDTGYSSYTWRLNHTTYTESGNYTTTITNADGCDSIITLNLTIIHPNHYLRYRINNDNTATITSHSATPANNTVEIYSWPQLEIPNSITVENTTYPVTAIGGWAFFQNDSITSISIPNSVTTIEGWAFFNCGNLTSITLSNSVIQISNNAFGACNGLTSIIIPNSVTSIDPGAFDGCNNITSLIVESGNPVYDSRNNCNAIIESATNTLIFGTRNTIIPNSIKVIGYNAFNSRIGLTDISIPNSVDTIEHFAFRGCKDLSIVNIERVTPPWMGFDVFINSPISSATLTVPCGAVSEYRNAEQWNNFRTIIAPDTCCHTTYDSISDASHNSYTWSLNGTTYSESGDYVDTILNANGCDSIVTLHLTISPCTIHIADLPYTENFDSYTTSTTTKTGVEPTCWTLTHMDVSMSNSLKPMIHYGTANAHSGDYALNLYKRGIYAMPEFEGSVNTLQMSMYVKQTQSAYQLIVGVMSDLDDESTFVPVATINNANTASTLATVDFSSYTGSGKFIAFRNINANPDNDFGINYIDDITLELSNNTPVVPDEPDEPENPCMIRIADLPYSENFDSYTTSTTTKTGVEPTCWTLAHMDVSMSNSLKPMIHYGTANAHSGDYALNLYKRGIYAMPEFEGSVNTLQMSMYVKQTQSAYQLIVGVMSDLDDESTFVPVATINNANTASTLATVDFSSYTGSGKFIAFRNTNANPDNDFGINYIDDITLEAASKQKPAEDVYHYEVSVFPNPTSGMLTIVADNVVNVDVFDFAGRKVASFESTTSIDPSNLAAGIYALRITTDNGTEVRKVVKE